MSTSLQAADSASVNASSARGSGLAGIGGVVLLGVVLGWLSSSFPTELPAWAPYDFSWISFLGMALPTFWYARGLATGSVAERPDILRILAFAAGVALIYTALLSRFVYLSQHMFFLNRLQHLGMHHVGPFLLALAWPGATIRRGMPDWVARRLRARWLVGVLGFTRQPLIAGALFAGLVALWLQPTIHFHAMLSPRLYNVMNWSMVVDGLLFWFLVLDPRPPGQAGCSYAARLAVTLLVELPQILIGSHLTFTTVVLYSYYDLCGRLFPSISAILDQHLGGVVVWIPQGMMGAIAFLLIMNNMRKHEDRAGGPGQNDIQVGGIRVSSSNWTGR
jgi:putative membrane protein